MLKAIGERLLMCSVFAIILLSLVCCALQSRQDKLDAREDGYRAGQIDALTGTVKYELIEQENGEVTWERIDE